MSDNYPKIKKELAETMGKDFAEKLDKEDSDTKLQWNKNTLLNFIIFGALFLLAFNEFSQTGSYVKLCVLLIGAAIGYCLYIITILFIQLVFYKIRIVLGKSLSNKEKNLILNNLIDMVAGTENKKELFYSSTCILDKDEATIKGYVVIIGASGDEKTQVLMSKDKMAQEIIKIRETLFKYHSGKNN